MGWSMIGILVLMIAVNLQFIVFKGIKSLYLLSHLGFNKILV